MALYNLGELSTSGVGSQLCTHTAVMALPVLSEKHTFFPLELVPLKVLEAEPTAIYIARLFLWLGRDSYHALRSFAETIFTL